jgi:tetratricopeptide (TPR) repeat protein
MREADSHFRAQRYADALRLTGQALRAVPSHPVVLHLHGLVLSRLGELEAAREALEAASRLAPRDPQIANNLGNLLRKVGEAGSALAAYDAAIAAAPRFAPARLHRAMVLDELARYDEARAELAALEALEPPSARSLMTLASVERNSGNLRIAAARLDQVLELDPAHGTARHARARIAAELGEPAAGALYRRAIEAVPDNRELLTGYIAAAETPELRQTAIERLSAAVLADPAWYEGHAALSAALWEDGSGEAFTAGFEAAVARLPADPRLWHGYAEALAKADEHAAAAEVCLRAERATGDQAFAAGAFSFLTASGRLDEAEGLLSRLDAGLLPPVALAKYRLRRGDPAAAERLLAMEVERGPDDIGAWALLGIAWHLLGDRRVDWLHGQEGLIGIEELPLEPDEVSAVAARLRVLHESSTVRINQSVRGGTQTQGNLFDRVEPEVALLRDSIRAAVERYRNALLPHDPAHPILRHRNSPFAFAGSWSVRLTAEGFHVQHIHPQGIVSAASYWAVPEPSKSDPGAGWLELGGTPAYLALDLPPMRRIEPRVGRLILFPSTLHHGTTPAPAGERMSVAFDVVPARS